METITAPAIAALMRVQRPVVSMWRTRGGITPSFPDPLTDRGGRELRFPLDEVVAWIGATGLGNNPHAVDDAPLFGSTAERLALERFEEASMLLSACALSGAEPLGVDETALVGLDPKIRGAVFSPREFADALADDGLRRELDRLVEAAFTPAVALGRLAELREQAARERPLACIGMETLTPLVEACADGMAAIAPRGAAAEQLAAEVLARREHAHEGILELLAADDLLERERGLALVRTALAHGVRATTAASASTGPVLRMLAFGTASESTPAAVFEAVEDELAELAPADRLLVIGPAAALIDRLGDADQLARVALLAPLDASGYLAPMRFAARLPEGLLRRGGRMRLAAWLFAQPERAAWPVAPDHVVGADHSNLCGPAEAEQLAGDALASLEPAPLRRSHAFLRAVETAPAPFLRGNPMPIGARATLGAAGPEALNHAEDAASRAGGDVLGDVVLTTEGATIATRTVPWRMAVARGGLAVEISGVRIARDELGQAGPRAAEVIGPEEVRGELPLGGRGIDRFELERRHGHAQLTRRGDVVFVSSGRPDAIVDWQGGRVVVAPARVLRCEPARGRGAVLDPAVVAADIRAQRGDDRLAWPLRLVPAGQLEGLRAVTAAMERRRAELAEELNALDELERVVHDGVAAGVLRMEARPAGPPPGTS